MGGQLDKPNTIARIVAIVHVLGVQPQPKHIGTHSHHAPEHKPGNSARIFYYVARHEHAHNVPIL